MKILQVIDTLNIGGAEKVCLNLITMLLDAGHQADCMVISTKGPLYESIDKRAKAMFLDRGSKFNLLKMHECASVASQYDIVHVHMRHTWAYVRLSALVFNIKTKMIFHDHFWEINTSKDATFRLKGIFKPAHYIGVSNDHINWARRFLRIDEPNTFLLANTIIPKYTQSGKYHGDMVMVSNLRSIKNIHFGITLANTLKRKLTVFGNHDGSEYAYRVVKLAEESEYVEIIQNETDIQQYLKNFTLAIHTSISETGPLVLLEYMAHGLPFITSETGEVPGQLKNVFPDMIAESFETVEWEQKINALEKRIRTEGEALASELKKIFAEKFSPDSYQKQCLEIYQNVLNC